MVEAYPWGEGEEVESAHHIVRYFHAGGKRDPAKTGILGR